MLVVSFSLPIVFNSFIEYDQFSVAGGSATCYILPLELHGGGQVHPWTHPQLCSPSWF